MNARPVEVPGTTTITATKVTAPPAWALMERQLFSLMEESARTYTSKYAERGGATLLAEDLDDLYEQFYNFGIFYALGGADDMLDLHLQQWNATNRISDQSFNHRPIHNNHTKKFTPAQHNEFWGMNHAMEWHHLGEGLMSWYDMGVADPTISENARRSRRFAGMYIGEDPEADLWDASKRIIRSPFQSSQGPMLEGDVNWANTIAPGGPLPRRRGKLLRRPRQPVPRRAAPRSPMVRESTTPGIHRRPVQQAGAPARHAQHPRGHGARYRRLPVHRRREVQAVGARLPRGVDRPYEAERRHHAGQRRPRRCDRRRTRGSVLGRPVRLEPLPGLQHHVPRHQHRRRMCPHAYRRLRVPRIAALAAQGHRRRGEDRGRRPAHHAGAIRPGGLDPHSPQLDVA